MPPHEYPNQGINSCDNLSNDRIKNSHLPAANSLQQPPSRSKLPEMNKLLSTATTATNKENNFMATKAESTTISDGAAKEVPIPKHIYDATAKSFYILGKFLGKGGFASCYQVSSEVSGKQFAVKIVPKSSLVKAKQKSKLLQEIKIHQSLRHDHIVRLYRVFEDDHFVYIVMELCECQTLMDLLRHKGRLTDDNARPILLQLLAAVEYLHTNHVIHRDLKLGNLFLKSGPTVKLGDFGLATLVYGENDRKRTICGTPNYIAPEIISGGEKGHSYEVDIWSFGVIMYTVLVGHPPFQRQEVKEIYEKIKIANFEFPDNVSVSLSAQDLINRLLHPNPELRPKIADIRSHPYFSTQFITQPQPHPSPAGQRRILESVVTTTNTTGAAAVNSSESGLIYSIQSSIRAILQNYSSVDSKIEMIPYPREDYLIKWMDFSSKYGIGYLLSNNSAGFYFNDGTSLILSSDKRRGHYFQPGDDNKKILVRESFITQDPKEGVKDKLEIMKKFEGFLQSSTSSTSRIITPTTSSHPEAQTPQAQELIFVVKFFRTSQATFFRLSHRVLQVNFFDHCKLIFGEEGRRITFIDQEKRYFSFSASISRIHISSAITGKLQYVSDVFISMVKTSSSTVIKTSSSPSVSPVNNPINHPMTNSSKPIKPSALGRTVFSNNNTSTIVNNSG